MYVSSSKTIMLSVEESMATKLTLKQSYFDEIVSESEED